MVYPQVTVRWFPLVSLSAKWTWMVSGYHWWTNPFCSVFKDEAIPVGLLFLDQDTSALKACCEWPQNLHCSHPKILKCWQLRCSQRTSWYLVVISTLELNLPTRYLDMIDESPLLSYRPYRSSASTEWFALHALFAAEVWLLFLPTVGGLAGAREQPWNPQLTMVSSHSG